MIQHFLWDQPREIINPVEKKKIRLRPYQTASVDAAYREWESNQSTLICLPTGCGKSVVFSEIMRRWPDHKKILVIAHRQELIDQARDHAANAGLVAGIEMGSQYATNESVIVSTVQTQVAGKKCLDCRGEGCDICVGSGKVRRMSRFNPYHFGLMVIDEGHHAAAKSYRIVKKYYAQNPNLKVLLVTATPKRADGIGLHNVCDSVAYEMGLRDAIDDGWLCPIRQRFVQVDSLDLSRVKTKAGGDLADGERERAFLGNCDEEQEKLLHAIAKPTIDEAAGHPALVFAAGKEHAKLLTAAFNAYDGITAECVLDDTPNADRKKIVERYKKRETHILVNCMCFTEGFDAPGTVVVANARPTNSESLYLQMIGRGTRPLAGVVDGPETPEARCEAIANSAKPFCIVLDFVGNSGKHKLVSVGDVLAGDDVDPIDLEEALTMAKSANAAVDMEELMEKAKQAREERKQKEEEERKKRQSTLHKAGSIDYTATDVDIFGRTKFGTQKAEHGARMLFGKHKGVLISKLEDGYLAWAAVNIDKKVGDWCKAEVNKRIEGGNRKLAKTVEWMKCKAQEEKCRKERERCHASHQ